jgi:hypothetical protein
MTKGTSVVLTISLAAIGVIFKSLYFIEVKDKIINEIKKDTGVKSIITLLLIIDTNDTIKGKKAAKITKKACPLLTFKFIMENLISIIVPAIKYIHESIV